MQITDFSPMITSTKEYPDQSPTNNNIVAMTPMSSREFERPMLIDIKTRKSYQVDDVMIEPTETNKIIKIKNLLEFNKK